MTQEEYIQKREELRQQEIKITTKRKILEAEYIESLNKPYEHLFNKKVNVIYKSWFGVNDIEKERTEVAYWGGYYMQFGEFRPRFYQVKKDGSMSSRELHLYPKEIISMEEVKN